MKRMALTIGLTIFIGGVSRAQFCDPPGEFVGTTFYPLQSLGSSSNRIAADQSGGVNVVWTNYFDPAPRYVFFNYRDEYGHWISQDGTVVDDRNGSGFPSLALFADGRLAIAYHNVSTQENYLWLAVNYWRGSSIFEYFAVSDAMPNGNQALWPRVAVSANGDIHVLMREFRESEYEGYLAYARSEDGGYTWSHPSVVDSISGYDGCITAAGDGHVAIVSAHPACRDESCGLKNDVCYFLSPDGRQWDFSDPNCITDYENDDLDIYCPWGIDAAFDPDGFLNVVWITGNINEEGQFMNDAASLWHYSERTGEINPAAQMTDPDVTCQLSGLPIDMPAISIDSSGSVEVIYAGYVDTDISSEGKCVGDLYMIFGIAFGQNWLGPFNLTATHTPGCLPGDCQSESQPSAAETMADSVHFTYVMQRLGPNRDTVYYMPVETPYRLGVDSAGDIPRTFRLYANHPNPFNSVTSIDFWLAEYSEVELEVFDITGAKVAALLNELMDSGEHSVNWDGGDMASGVYYYRLSANGEQSTRKMTLLK